jgi:Zn finger protein HypA/HybF involved in hydrogenase expression
MAGEYCVYKHECPDGRMHIGIAQEPAKIRCPKCDGPSEFVKLYEKNRYDGFMRCMNCGHEGRVYTSKQNALKNWR